MPHLIQNKMFIWVFSQMSVGLKKMGGIISLNESWSPYWNGNHGYKKRLNVLFYWHKRGEKYKFMQLISSSMRLT